MSRKTNNLKGGKKDRGYGLKGGMRKHRVSGVPGNKSVTMQRSREENMKSEKEHRLKEKRKKRGLYGSVSEAFKNNMV